MYVMPNSTVSDTTRESAQSHFSHSLQTFGTRRAAIRCNIGRKSGRRQASVISSRIRRPAAPPETHAAARADPDPEFNDTCRDFGEMRAALKLARGMALLDWRRQRASERLFAA